MVDILLSSFLHNCAQNIQLIFTFAGHRLGDDGVSSRLFLLHLEYFSYMESNI